MLTAVHLDHQTVFHTGKIDDVGAYGTLPANFVASQAAITQYEPQTPLGIRRVLSEILG